MSVDHVDERAVADVWERQAFDPSALHALGLSVVFRGLPSDAGGPDYQDAILLRHGRATTAGDIEFHVSASDWYAHGHHRDSHYDSVILHVVWYGGEETRASTGLVIPTLVLERHVAGPVPLQLGIPAFAHPCVARYRALPAPQLSAAIRRAGLNRFRERAERFAADLSGEVTADQVLYTAMLEALGYASNRSVFRALADAAPHPWIMSLPREHRERALLSAAGLGDDGGYDPPARVPRDSWRLTRLRPANHPTLRLRGMSTLIERHAPSLDEGLARSVLDAATPAAAVRALTVRDNSASPIGAGRATEVLASAVLPFLAARYPEDGRAEALFRVLPAPPKNRWTRKMLHMLQDAGQPCRVVNAADHQGLHWLYHSHCRYERRSGCPVCDPSVSASLMRDTDAG